MGQSFVLSDPEDDGLITHDAQRSSPLCACIYTHTCFYILLPTKGIALMTPLLTNKLLPTRFALCKRTKYCNYNSCLITVWCM